MGDEMDREQTMREAADAGEGGWVLATGARVAPDAAPDAATEPAPEPAPDRGAWRLGVARTVARFDRVSFARPLALLMGAALSFALLAMPPWWLAQAPAQGAPPLIPISLWMAGVVRVAIALIGGSAGALAVWALFRALERPMREPVLMPVDPAAPRLRRWDAHPDAPSRPILAAAELGAPLDADEAEWAPSRMWGGVAEVAVAPEPEPEPAVAGEPAPDSEAAADEEAGAADVTGAEADMLTEPLVPETLAPPAHETAWRPIRAVAHDAEQMSAAALMARLEAALAVRPTAARRDPNDVLRVAVAELRKIGNGY